MNATKVFLGVVLSMLLAEALGQDGGIAFRSIQLNRTGCLGSCPVYSVTVEADGSVRFVGDEYVAQLGTHESKVAPEAVARLQSELKKAAFFSLRSRKKGRLGCLRAKSDHPSVVVRTVTPTDDKTVSFYTGCPETKDSAALVKLADAIDEIANTANWIGSEQL